MSRRNAILARALLGALLVSVVSLLEASRSPQEPGGARTPRTSAANEFVIPRAWGELRFTYHHPNVGGSHYMVFVADDGTIRRVHTAGGRLRLQAVFRRQE